MLHILGSQGEGGGQILRTGLSLACALKRSITIDKIRYNRSPSGLSAQHLTCANAINTICGGRMTGNTLRSTRLEFFPDTVIPGDYEFHIGTAGSCLLVLQTLVPPLITANGKSKITVHGGTAVPFSPSFHYFSEVYIPFLQQQGIDITVECSRFGFYPKGGGTVSLYVTGKGSLTPLRPISLLSKGNLLSVSLLSACSQSLPDHINERQMKALLSACKQRFRCPLEQRLEKWDTLSPSTFAFIRLDYEQVRTAFFSFGKRGLPAEKVAANAVSDLDNYLAVGEGVVDCHFSDQLITLLALSMGKSEFITSCITLHSLTNADVVNLFYPSKIRIEGQEGSLGVIHVDN
ncbi:hypothetical protein GEMRC1_003251 [Eukaryota sp. GEM-RC1]